MNPRREIDSVEALATALAEAGEKATPVRLSGSGQWDAWLPPIRAETQVLSTAPMDRITRLDAADLTCSVEPGVTLGALAEALAPHRLRLPCAVGRSPAGTVAGLVAADPIGALAPGGPEPRSLLLGMSGMLSDGTRFKTGAKVVKSVAGFDLHKLFVGSEGSLFAATELHLKLRPEPRASAGFDARSEDWPPLWDLMTRMRCSATPPAGCVLELEPGSARLRGWFEGSAAAVRLAQRTFGLEETPRPRLDGCVPEPSPHHLRTVVPMHAFGNLCSAEGGGLGNALSATLTGGGRLWLRGTVEAVEGARRMFASQPFARSSRPAGRPPFQRQALTTVEDRIREALDPARLLR